MPTITLIDVDGQRITREVHRLNPNGTFHLHRDVETSRPGISVDEGIRDLIESLWANGFDTQHSCQDMWPETRPGVAQVAFAAIEDGYRFLTDSVLAVADLDWTRRNDEFVLKPAMPEDAGLRGFVYFPAARIGDLAAFWSCRTV